LRESHFSGEKGGTYVCSFSFADLRHDGFLSLVAGIGVRNRPSCAEVVIIDRTRSGFEMYRSGGDIGTGQDIPSSIQDLRHDGSLELVLPEGLAIYPQQCAANWETIFAWNGANFSNVSAQFKNFYEKRLDYLRKIIPVLPPIRPPGGNSVEDKECLEAEEAALQRFLGLSKDAGIDQAIRLATSDDRLARQFGTVLLLQIGTPRRGSTLRSSPPIRTTV
jgi:hypothetical protein